MKTQYTQSQPARRNNVLGLYTIFMVSLSVTYTVSTLLQHLG